eukprot:TRINITY_DN19373_c0_g1_i1.p1 TRINITY_DN19373_c0_g1~~TRINITY_DN19373_c0_g1_i1.p1  ORF type:complete len:550 (+),score=73.76 TRINITY_DN19373_c0_g1_i1:596-2245(+)
MACCHSSGAQARVFQYFEIRPLGDHRTCSPLWKGSTRGRERCLFFGTFAKVGQHGFSSNTVSLRQTCTERTLLTFGRRRCYRPMTTRSLPPASMSSGTEGSIGESGRRGFQVPLLDSFLAAELLPPLLQGTAAFTFLASAIGSASELSGILRSGASLAVIVSRAVQVVLLRAPAYVVLALPMALLLAPLLGFGRPGAVAELTVLRACGIGRRRLVERVGAGLLLLTLVHAAIAEGIVPHANRAAFQVMAEAAGQQSGPAGTSRRNLLCLGLSKQAGPTPSAYEAGVARQQEEVRRHRLQWLLRGQGRGDGPGLQQMVLLQMPDSKRPLQVTVAAGAVWDEETSGWLLWDGVRHTLQYEQQSQQQQTPRSPAQRGAARWPSGSLAEGEGRASPDAAATEDAAPRAKASYFRQPVVSLPGVGYELHALQQEKDCSTDELTLKEMLKRERLLRACHRSKESRRLQLKIQQRLALPFACVVFGVLATSLSLRMQLQGAPAAVGVTLALVLGYYGLSVTGALLAQLRTVPPLVGAWLPNVAGCVAAFLTLRGLV